MDKEYRYKVLYEYSNSRDKRVNGSKEVKAMRATDAMNRVEMMNRQRDAIAHTAIRLTKGSRPLAGPFEIQG